MTIFLRNEHNKTVVDIELWEKGGVLDLRVATDIPNYSKILLANPDRQQEVIQDFENIDEMRGWLWEVYMESESPNFKQAKEEVNEKLLTVAKKYNLHIVTD